jgi:putative ABC transport system substrate-binding protein
MKRTSLPLQRREFIAGLGGAVVWPLATRAQQPNVPLIGFLGFGSPDDSAARLRAFRQGLQEAGFVEGQSVAIQFRWGEGRNGRMPALAFDLVRQQVAVIAALGGTASALAAKTATTTIPIVFAIGGDPVGLGLVASLNRPGGNITGVTGLNAELGAKRLELLHEMIPTATIVAALMNPTNPDAEAQSGILQAAARVLGLELHILHVSSQGDFETVLANLAKLRAGALAISGDQIFIRSNKQLADWTARHAVPTIFPFRQFAANGGLMSYGADVTDIWRLAGGYAGRLLKGEKPGDLPVQQSTKIELILNLKTAKALRLTVPQSILLRADEVIE